MQYAEAVEASFFPALRDRERPAAPHLRRWWACDAAREHRGDSHVAAAGAAGLDAVQRNVLTELWLGMPLLSSRATRAWSPEQVGRAVEVLRARGLLDGDPLTASGQAARDEVEAATERRTQPLLDLLGDDLGPLCDRLEGRDEARAARRFPADVHERAAG